MTRPRLKAAVLGATGTVGQRLVRRLHDHPLFHLTRLAASSRSVGRRYRDATHWLLADPLPEAAGTIEVCDVREATDCDVAFSALGSSTALEMEPFLAANGVAVVSNASALRMHPQVPLVIPEVNPGHLEMLEHQDFGPGSIITNPNCATVGLVLGLKPLADAFGIEAVQATTLQAISGAGHPGVASLDILGNALPLIPGEEEKLETEPQKILGAVNGSAFVPAAFPVSAQTNRVPVVDGHLVSVSVKLCERASVEDAARAIGEFQSPVADMDLPSAPRHPVELAGDGPRPQPKLDLDRGRGMTVTVGRIRRCPVFDIRFVALVHNTERGAAGAAVLNAELLAASGRLD